MNTNIPPQQINAYSLAKFSRGAELYGQIEKSREECKRRGWTFNESLSVTDLGVSKFHGKSCRVPGALGQFVKASDCGLLLPNPVLIVEQIDRTTAEQVNYVDEGIWSLVKRGVDLLFLSFMMLLTKGDENDINKRTMLMLEASRAYKSSQRISEKIKAAYDRKISRALKGEAVNFSRNLPTWISYIGDDQNGVFVLNDRAKEIRHIVHLYLGGKSISDITQLLNASKSRNSSGWWTRSTVLYFLKNEALIGTMTIQNKRLERYLPAVLTQSEWDALRLALQSAWKNRNRDRILNLFRLRCTCAACGGPAASVRSEEKLQRMRCKSPSQNCDPKAWLYNEAIEMDFFANYLREFRESVLAISAQALKRRNQLQEQLHRVEVDLQQSMSLLDELPSSAIKEKLSSLARTKHDIERELEIASAEALLQEFSSQAVAKLTTAFDSPASSFLQLTANHLRRLQDNSLRAKLLTLIPNVISGIVVDFPRKSYAVRDLNGNRGEWRDVSGYKPVTE